MTDRHRQPRLTIRASAEQITAWRRAAAGSLTAFVVAALDSHVASLKTSKLKPNKLRSKIYTGASCPDSLCAKPKGHAGRCDFLKNTEVK